MSDRVKAKAPCCQSKVRCKRCPVVLKRLEKAGLAQRKTKRTYAVASVSTAQLTAARRRKPAG